MSDLPSNLSSPRASLTDSAWFWVMLFSCMSLLAMQLIDWKYNQRQAQLERQFQGREWAAQHGAQVQMNPQSSTERAAPVPVVAQEEQGGTTKESVAKAAGPANDPSAPSYSRPGQLVISLLPLRALAVTVLVISSFLLWRQTRATIPPVERQAS